jgi:HK97 family phage prohead protease
LRLTEDAKGLLFTISPPATGWAKDLMTSVARRDVTGASFGFTVPDGGDTWSRRDGRPIRELLRVVLIEISIVSWPAYPQTEVHVREEISSEIRAELNRRRARVQQLVGA